MSSGGSLSLTACWAASIAARTTRETRPAPRLVAAFPQVLVHEGGDPQRHVLARSFRLLLDRTLSGVAGQGGETDHQDQGDAEPP